MVIEAKAAISAAPASSELIYFTERGSGPSLLLVHGALFTGDMYAPVLDHFATRYRVIVPDLRGHGRSRGLPPPYMAAQHASDLSRLLDRLDIDSTAVLGYSQGGTFAQQLVLDYPRRCNRLVLACTYACNTVTAREKLEGNVSALLIQVLGMKRFAKFVVSQAMKQLDTERAAWAAGVIADQDGRLMVPALRGLVAFDSRRRLAEIRCPTLVVAGSNDEAVPIHHANMLHTGIPGSQVAIIEGADHALIWTHSYEFVRAVDEFLAA